jgi:hypothetical protein|tara:strand:+ start:3820 stop:4227 length:408 start_codon:yes stop_codon:yes gene_type:complete
MLATLLPEIFPVVSDIIGRFLPEDKEARAKAEREIEQQLAVHLARIDIGQLEINKAEAASRHWWTASWRPFIGWSCGIALFWTYVATPVLHFILAQTGHLVELPALDMSQMMPILMGILGLGGLRTFEKFKNVTK